MSGSAPSPIAEIYEALGAAQASWRVEVGRPAGPGWIAGDDLRHASSGPLHELLERIGARAQTTNRRTIAASFALRYGWASAMVIAPYLKFACVPDVSLDNVSLKFRESTFLGGTAVHEPRGVLLVGSAAALHPAVTAVADRHALLRALRKALVNQAAPVVEALYEWSGFAPRGTWGMLTSSWAAQITALSGDDQCAALPVMRALFEGDDVVAVMQPGLHTVTHDAVTRVFQRRASCCRYYLLPQGDLCASCPLVPHDERLVRNRAWMKTQLERRGDKKDGHA